MMNLESVRTPPRRRHRVPLFSLLLVVLLTLPLAAAQAIGDELATFLDATGAIVVDGEGDGYRIGDLALALEAPNDILAGVTLSGDLTDDGLQSAASTLAIATGYGAGIEEPLRTFLRDRAPTFAGEGPVRISVEAFTLELLINDAELSDVTLALSLPRIDAATFGPPVATVGDPDAPVTIRVFSDFQCPFCGRYASEVQPGIEAGPITDGTANFAFHHFPLTTIHANAVPAAEAAQCVVEQFGDEAFWAYHDLLFERVSAWGALGDPNPYFARVAREVGPLVEVVAERNDLEDDAAGDLAVERVEACLEEGETRDSVEASLAVARELGLGGTPSVFVGGYRLNDFGNPQAYTRLIRLARAQAPAATSE